jgi:hypothetical protein
VAFKFKQLENYKTMLLPMPFLLSCLSHGSRIVSAAGFAAIVSDFSMARCSVRIGQARRKDILECHLTKVSGISKACSLVAT